MAELNGGYHRQEVEAWLKEVPGYRELIRQRVSEVQRRRVGLDRRLLKEELGGVRDEVFGTITTRDYYPVEASEDVDHLGREVEGCG